MRHEVRARVKMALGRKDVDLQTMADAFSSQLLTMPEMVAAKNILVYLNLPDEVPVTLMLRKLFFCPNANEVERTTPIRNIAIPYCRGKELEVFRLSQPSSPEATATSLENEVEQGEYGILEPKNRLRNPLHRAIHFDKLDLVLVPGIAFDMQGGRLGRGAGYYDRFLTRLTRRTLLVALALEEQIVPAVPMEAHDIRVGRIVKMGSIHITR